MASTVASRLRTVFSNWFGGFGGAFAPWHLARDARPPITVNAQTALTLTAVFKACSLLSDAATSAPAVAYARPQSGGRVVDLTSAAARALATIAHADMELFAFSTALTGNGYLRILRDGNGAPQELRAVPPYTVTLEIEAGTRALWYRIAADPHTGEPEHLLPEADIAHAKFRVTSHRLMGTPPMQSCAPAFEQALQSRAVQKYLFQNLSMPGVAILAPGKMDPLVANKLQAEWDENYRAGGAGKTAVLSNGLDVKPFLWKAGDQQLLEQIQASVQDIARAYAIPQYFLEHLATTTYASASEAQRSLFSSAQKPFTLRLADALAQKLISRNDRAAGAGVEFDLSATLIMPGKEMSDFLGGLVGSAICTPNEVRNLYLRLPDLAGGDVLRIPGGTTPSDQAPLGAKLWQPGRKYEVGCFVVHDAGLWQRSPAGCDEEPSNYSAGWDCVAPGIRSIEMVDGSLSIAMSNGHRKTVRMVEQ